MLTVAGAISDAELLEVACPVKVNRRAAWFIMYVDAQEVAFPCLLRKI
jgi:hypothetical protein